MDLLLICTCLEFGSVIGVEISDVKRELLFLFHLFFKMNKVTSVSGRPELFFLPSIKGYFGQVCSLVRAGTAYR